LLSKLLAPFKNEMAKVEKKIKAPKSPKKEKKKEEAEVRLSPIYNPANNLTTPP
jgi:hypothetical protein